MNILVGPNVMKAVGITTCFQFTQWQWLISSSLNGSG